MRGLEKFRRAVSREGWEGELAFKRWMCARRAILACRFPGAEAALTSCSIPMICSSESRYLRIVLSRSFYPGSDTSLDHHDTGSAADHRSCAECGRSLQDGELFDLDPTGYTRCRECVEIRTNRATRTSSHPPGAAAREHD